jgi:hypothetical protein
MTVRDEVAEAIARDDRRDEIRSKQVPEDLKDKPWAWDMYFALKAKNEATQQDQIT